MSSLDNSLVLGLERLRKASLYMIISMILLVIGTIAVTAFLISVSYFTISISAHGYPFGFSKNLAMSHNMYTPSLALIGSFIVLVIILFAGLILWIIATYVHLIPAFDMFKAYKHEHYSTPAMLLKIGYIGGLIVLIVAIMTVLAAAAAHSMPAVFVGIGLVAIGYILVIIGHIGLIVGLFRLNTDVGETMFLISAILMIIALVLSFIPSVSFAGGILNFIAWILIYIASKSSLGKLGHIT